MIAERIGLQAIGLRASISMGCAVNGAPAWAAKRVGWGCVAMKDQTIRRSLRGAIYTRVSTEQGLDQDFNSLDAQREA